MSQDNEASMPPEMVRKVLASAPSDVILIGGQALAFWVGFYEVKLQDDMQMPAVSRDVDFFTSDAANTMPLSRFASAINGEIIWVCGF